MLGNDAFLGRDMGLRVLDLLATECSTTLRSVSIPVGSCSVDKIITTLQTKPGLRDVTLYVDQGREELEFDRIKDVLGLDIHIYQSGVNWSS
ncbi:hypothetical protein HDV00_011494 [Rhizophlyctis rosea]|nr:hypothetical protein HDV00_011494 [Rhizophlyctis rosea]